MAWGSSALACSWPTAALSSLGFAVALALGVRLAFTLAGFLALQNHLLGSLPLAGFMIHPLLFLQTSDMNCLGRPEVDAQPRGASSFPARCELLRLQTLIHGSCCLTGETLHHPRRHI